MFRKEEWKVGPNGQEGRNKARTAKDGGKERRKVSNKKSLERKQILGNV